MAIPLRQPPQPSKIIAGSVCLARRYQFVLTVALISLLVYLLDAIGVAMAVAYSVPVGLAAIRSLQTGLKVAIGSTVGYAMARILVLIRFSLVPPVATWPGLDLGQSLWFIASIAVPGIILVGIAYALNGQICAFRRLFDRTSEETRIWREEVIRLERIASESSSSLHRLETQVRSRSAPILQVTHKLRAPVATIQSCLDVVLEGYADHSPELQRRMIQSARDSAVEMLALVGDVLRLGELREAALVPSQELVNVEEIAARMASTCRAEALLKSIQLDVEIGSGLAQVRMKKTYLEELFRNLLDNAIKYNVDGGHVWLKLWQADGFIRGEVGDTGIGIQQKDLTRIFDEFYRADNARETVIRGTGLGLPIVKQIIELSGGSIEVHSKLGEGTTFTFSLPASPAVPVEVTAKPPNSEDSQSA